MYYICTHIHVQYVQYVVHAHTYNPNTLTHAPQRIQHLKIFFPGDATVHTHDTACIR
jgi:hypothetical protein